MSLLSESVSPLLRVQCNESKNSLVHCEHELGNSDFDLHRVTLFCYLTLFAVHNICALDKSMLTYSPVLYHSYVLI